MDDKKIEDLLKRAYAPQAPEEMRDRVLVRHRSLLREVVTMRWKLALAGLTIVFVVFAGVSDGARTARIAEMSGCSAGDRVVVRKDLNKVITKWNRRLIANAWAEDGEYSTREDDLP